MYDGEIQDFMGYYDNDAGEYVYPSVPQNLVVAFSPDSPATPFYLSAIDGDFSADGVVFTTEIGPSEDTTIGNAPAKVMTASMLNPEGTMGDLPWEYGAAYIGSLRLESPADFYGEGHPVSIVVFNVGGFSIDASGNARIPGGTAFTLGGEPTAIVANYNGTDVLYITDTKIGRYLNGSFSVVTTPTASQEYLAKKYRDFPTTIGVMLDANGCPVKYNCEETNISRTYTYIPMGTYDFSDVDARGLAFTVEAYDKMVLFDADATDWINSLDFTSPKTVSDLIDELMTVSGFTASIDSRAVNLSFSYDANPLSGYTVTYRQVLKWLAEMIGCNVRMGRTDVIEFFPYVNSARVFYYPDIIVSGSRTTARYNTPNIREVICYDFTGTPYSSGVIPPAPGMNYGSYYIVSNPLFQGLSQDTTILSSINSLFGTAGTAMWGYRPTTISAAYSFPGVDVGDMVHITAMDGSTEIIPVMHQTLRWNGICSATITATGKQQRTIPDGEITSLTGSVGNSNPVAAVQGYFGGISVASADYPNDSIDVFPDSITLEDATHTKTISASGPTPTSGYAQVSVPTGTAYKTITQFDLEPGTYLVQIHFAFATNTSGRRVGIVSYSQNSSAQISAAWRASAAPVNGENTFLNICGIIRPNTTTTFYLNAMQNSGSGLNTFASYNYVRLA